MSRSPHIPPDRAGSPPARPVDARAEWRSLLTRVTGAGLLLLTATGLAVTLLPFGGFAQISLLLHTAAGVALMAPLGWYVLRHWRVRRHGNLSHHQLLGYMAGALVLACVVSGVVVTWQGATGPRLSPVWDQIHLASGLLAPLLAGLHLLAISTGKMARSRDSQGRALASSRRAFYGIGAATCLVALAAVAAGSAALPSWDLTRPFPANYNWAFGEDRPFAPSLTRVDDGGWEAEVRARVLEALPEPEREAVRAAMRAPAAEPAGLFTRVRRALEERQVAPSVGADVEEVLAWAATVRRQTGSVDPAMLAGSAGCGTSGCHEEIYREWLPSAHRYSSMDDMFQKVQSLMAVETSPEHTRYCAGCHDPISLLSGAKNSDNVTLSAVGADEGISCLVCHSIVQTDIQGNADYTIRLPRRYLLEMESGATAKAVSDFLIRAYPRAHVAAYSRPLYKTPEFCGACHKQYVDTEVNTDIGKVQGQNQYDSWKGSRWNHGPESPATLTCRECHMPLRASRDPARGDGSDSNRSPDDGRHRSHSTLGSNQYMPLVHGLEGAEEHVRLTEEWLQGRIQIPEIAGRWTDGPVVRLDIQAPAEARPGDTVPVRVTLTNNKTGHDFPTGPLDMIESWIELVVTAADGTVLLRQGGLDNDGRVAGSPVLLRADGFDRRGEPIDRHNLWDLVGASYKRALYPGMTDAFEVDLQCPSMARGRLADDGPGSAPGRRRQDYVVPVPQDAPRSITIRADLWYRKANPEFLDRVYGAETGTRSPLTRVSSARAVLRVSPEATPAP